MKRTSTQKWKNNGGGHFYALINGVKRIIKPGQVFEARLEEIPEAFKDVLIQVSKGEVVTATTTEAVKAKEPENAPEPEAVPDPEPEVAAEPKYEVQSRGGGYYNVVDENGKVMNEKALRQAAAEELLKTLQ